MRSLRGWPLSSKIQFYFISALVILQITYQGQYLWMQSIVEDAPSQPSKFVAAEKAGQIRVSMKGHPQFVFLMGTEGSGHHLWSSLIGDSPNMIRLQELGLLPAAEDITHQLFSKDHLDNSLFAGSACHPEWNGTYLVEETARKLSLVAKALPHNMTVPLNGLPSTKPISGMISYPNFRRPTDCDGFRFPDQRLLQQACQNANVSCHFILQYRDPIAILRSTTIHRRLHSIGYAISLYTSMYMALTMQLSAIPSSSLQYCWEYNDTRPSAQLGVVLGYTTHEEFLGAFASHFVSSKNNKNKNNQTLEAVVPPHYELPFQSMLVAYEHLKSKCLHILDS